jgi:hypothetical protein
MACYGRRHDIIVEQDPGSAHPQATTYPFISLLLIRPRPGPLVSAFQLQPRRGIPNEINDRVEIIFDA